MTRTGLTATIAAILIGLSLSNSAAAGKPNPAEVTLKTDKVIIFKDGYTMFIRSGEGICDEKGELFIHDIPDSAVLGSFWATSDDGPPAVMRAGFHTTTNTIKKEVACTRYIDILEANKGSKCTLTMNDNNSYTGAIREVLIRKSERTVQPSYLASIGARSALSSLPLSNSQPAPTLSVAQTQGSHFVLRTEKGDVLLPVSSIRTLTMKDITTTTTDVVTETVKRKRLTLSFGKPGKKKKVTLMYFRPGMRWIPTYRIDLTSKTKKTAKMTLQAEILNEAEDLHNVPVDIVVGVPNFRFRTVVSPLILERVLRDALQQAAPQIMGRHNQFSNALFSQRASEHVVPYSPPSPSHNAGGSISLPSELTAGGTQDLFVYSLPKMTLAKGERAAAHIFNSEVAYRDVYTWDVRIQKHDIATAPSGSGITSPLTLSKNQVWHQVELTNNTKVPWTTGAAMIMQGMQPLAQELLTYTSSGGTVRVPVTVSVDSRGTVTEKEIGRQLKALIWDRNHYAKISNEAKLRLVNRKSIDIDVEVTLRFGGKTDSVTDDGDIMTAPYNSADWQHYRGSSAANNSTVITWVTTIRKGKSFNPSVNYHYYARH